MSSKYILDMSETAGLFYSNDVCMAPDYIITNGFLCGIERMVLLGSYA